MVDETQEEMMCGEKMRLNKRNLQYALLIPKFFDGFIFDRRAKAQMQRDVCEFLVKEGYMNNGQTLEFMGERWMKFVNETFDASDTDKFYRSWIGYDGACSVAYNVRAQLRRHWVSSSLIRYCKHGVTVLDLGCETGVATLAFQRFFMPSVILYLSELEHTAKDFHRFYTKKYPEFDIRIIDVDLNSVPDKSLDIAVCLHVLEHLPNATEVFLNLDSKIKQNGLLILEAPFKQKGGLGCPDHILDATVDWTGKGAEILNDHYKKLKNLDPFVFLSGLYQKV